MRPRIDAVDSIHLHARASDVFAILLDFRRYATWWPAPIRFEVTSPASGAGASLRISNGPLVKWTARVREIIPGRLIRFDYGQGAWEGTAEWMVAERDEGCDVSYRISITPATAWLRLLGKVLNLSRLHSRAMARALEGLRAVAENRAASARGRRLSG